MFWFRESHDPAHPGRPAHVAFTDAELDLQGLRPGFPGALAAVEQACGVGFARMSQVHGDVVVEVEEPMSDPTFRTPSCDALLTTTPGVGLMVRAADCVPLVLAGDGVVAAAHAGRPGVVVDVTTRTVEAMAAHGADPARLTAWVGPHVCGACYEVPEQMRDDVAATVPETRAETSWGTPSVDIGAGVRAQLARAGVTDVREVGGCTREEPRLHSYRRDGTTSGRHAGLVWLDAGDAR
ncbi:peptidoglycan editing factor PgeF [Nocardioides marinquilinus]|uniref:Peptidoglycan editing factor PgeF n=1 Tax=Nocardioides marinquilinus TaxID=1210400 RepID=A0ABP9PTF0_9ACTN